MSLTATDLKEIRTIIREEVRPIIREEVVPIVRDEVRPIVREEVQSQLDARIIPLEGHLEAVEDDIKEIYFMVSDLQVTMAKKA